LSRQNNTQKTLGNSAALVVTTLHDQRRPVFRLADAREITGLSAHSTATLLDAMSRRGVVTRLAHGLYGLVPYELGSEREYFGDPLLVGRELMADGEYYFSHATAMEYHHMLTQPQLAVTISTSQPRRPLVIGGTEFRFVRCDAKHLWGYGPVWVSKQERVNMSDLERTVLDGLRLPLYAGGVTEVAKGLWLRRADIDPDRLAGYALRLGVGAVTRRLGLLLETYEIADEATLDRLRETLTSTYQRLDPLLPAEGRRLRRWRLQLNVEPDELRQVVAV
jgi:predicted transcriptional regulator of viral defense system